MTDRIRCMTVWLENELREDDARELAGSIGMFRGVDHVELGAPVTSGDRMAKQLAKLELRKQLIDLLTGRDEP